MVIVMRTFTPEMTEMRRLGAAALALLVGSTGFAWTFTSLHAAPYTYSDALAGDGNYAFGTVAVSNFHAAIWSGFSNSPTLLTPAGRDGSQGFGASGSQQVGQTTIGPEARAALWAGSSGSFVDLHPATATRSLARATDGIQQVGEVRIGGDRAALWSGTAGSFVNLHPTGYSSSYALAVAGGRQGGYANLSGVSRAMIWSGTASSFVSLSQGGSVPSVVNAMTLTQQGGSNNSQAALWAGTAASLQSLHPAGFTTSSIEGMTDGFQVGAASFASGESHAMIWQGNASSAFDLHTITSGYSHTLANAVWVSGNTVYVVGTGRVAATGSVEALLWSQAVPEPATLVGLGLAGLALGRRMRPRA